MTTTVTGKALKATSKAVKEFEFAWPAGIFAVGIASFAMAIGTAFAPAAQAIPPGPNSCVSGGGGFIGWGGYEDCDLWQDGSFYHREWGGGPFASGGRSFRACDGMPPIPTDSDPRTPC